MTKTWGLLPWALALAFLLALPPVQAHGAPPVREVDTRVLLDDDGLVAFGGCVEDQCQPASPPAGLDLLALDLREASFPDGAPAVVFRILVQSEEPAPGVTVAVSFQLAGAEKTLEVVTTDGLAYSSTTFDRVDGPFDVGDGHPKAIDGWVRFATLGVAPGDALTSIQVASRHGDTQDDAMPGGWFSNGVEVPHVPDEPDPGELMGDEAASEYQIKGAAPLLGLTAEPATADLAKGPATVKLRLANAVGLPQFADLAVAAPAGITVRLGQASVSLDAGGQRDIDLFVSNATLGGIVRVTVVSDLGAYGLANVTVVAPPVAPAATSSSSAPAAGAKDSPAPVGLGLGLGVLALAIIVRSRVDP